MAPVLLGSGQPAFGLYGLVAPMKMYHLPIVILAGLALCMLSTAQPITPDAEPAPVPVAKVVQPELPELGSYFPARCVNVVDGDTIDVEVRKVIRIRLNVWCCEKHGPQKEMGLKAKYAMEKIAKDRPGVVIIPWKDALKDELTLDRVLGRFVVNGTDVGKEMIRKKLGAATKEELAEMYPEKK